MADIKIDYSKLEKAAREIETYMSKHQTKMNMIDSSVTSLGSSWQGKDYNRFKTQWRAIKGTGSTSNKMLKSLDSYADLLRFAANKYKSAQLNAINRAGRLPK